MNTKHLLSLLSVAAALVLAHGKLVWSFDLATPGTDDITGILVDALSGKINAIEKETSAQQESERRAKTQEKRSLCFHKAWETHGEVIRPFYPPHRG